MCIFFTEPTRRTVSAGRRARLGDSAGRRAASPAAAVRPLRRPVGAAKDPPGILRYKCKDNFRNAMDLKYQARPQHRTIMVFVTSSLIGNGPTF